MCFPSSTFLAKRAPVWTSPSTMPATVNTPPMIAHVVVMKWYLHSSIPRGEVKSATFSLSASASLCTPLASRATERPCVLLHERQGLPEQT